MPSLKSIFVSTYLVAAAWMTGHGIWALAGTGGDRAWAGAVLAAAAPVAFFAWLMITRFLLRTSPSTPRHIWLVVALTLGGLGLAAYGAAASVRADLLPVAYAAVAATGWGLYDFWYSGYGATPSPKLATGRRLPDFDLEDPDGVPISSGSFQGRPTLLIFYRGNWCPLCMAQIREVAASYRELEERGVQTILVSPQPHGHTAALAKRFDVPMRFLVDPKNRAARALGIADEGGLPLGMQMLGYDTDTVRPTVLLTDSDRRILYCDLTSNYRLRPDPREILAAFPSPAAQGAATGA